MGRLKTSVLRKLQKILTQQFPAPATVKLQEHDGIIGVVTSSKFASMETIERQDLIGEIIAKHLTADERRQVQMIVCVTPEEGTGYLAGVK